MPLKITILMGTMLLAALQATAGVASDQIRIVGSSTVYPFAASVAEHFGKMGDFRTPVVESTGTGAGLKLFCEGVDMGQPDITDASRVILPGEREQCARNGVHDIVEVKIGFDGIALANSAKAPQFHLTRRDIFMALAREVPDASGRLSANPFHSWKQVNAALPDIPIRVYGMPPVSGTRDTFVELVMEKGCAEAPPLLAAVSEQDKKRHCKTLREDGAFIEAGENGNLIVQKLLGDEEALGILGFSFLDQNTGLIHASYIENALPEFDTIQKGTYPISRPLYFYVKGEHIGKVPGLREFIQEFLSDGATGDEGYLVPKGLVPLPPEERAHVKAAVMQAVGGHK